MSMNFEELDVLTRRYMLAEFENEEKSGNPYRSSRLNPLGQITFPQLMYEAIQTGGEQSLISALMKPTFWVRSEPYTSKNGFSSTRAVNLSQAAEQLGSTEFNTWYVRGFSKRLLEENVEYCQVYRAAQPKWQPAECSAHEGQVYRVQEVYNGHRARYWPKQNHTAFSIPFGTGCHHTIRRTR